MGYHIPGRGLHAPASNAAEKKDSGAEQDTGSGCLRTPLISIPSNKVEFLASQGLIRVPATMDRILGSA